MGISPKMVFRGALGAAYPLGEPWVHVQCAFYPATVKIKGILLLFLGLDVSVASRP